MKKRIVVVEDDTQTAELLKIILDGAGFEVVNLYHGVDAVRFLEKEKFDLVLLDIRLPGYDGFEILEWLRTQSDKKAVPVVMLSADVMTNSRLRASDLGAVDYVCKPFQIDDLVNRIGAAMETAASTAHTTGVFPWPAFTPTWQHAAAD